MFEDFYDQYGYANNKDKDRLRDVFENPGKYSYDDLLNALNNAGLGQDAGKSLAQGYASDKADGNDGLESSYYDLYLNRFNTAYNSFVNDFVGRLGGLGGGGNAAEEEDKGPVSSTVGGNTVGGPTYNVSDATTTIPGVEGIEGKSVRDLVGPDYTPRSGRGTGGLESFASRFGGGPNLGPVALGEALKSGYTVEDIASQRGSLPFEVMGRANDVLNNPTQISPIFGPGIGAEHQNRTMFGHEDYYVNRARGFSDLAIKEYMDRNLGLLASNNKPGQAGGVYDLVASRLPAPIEGREAIAGQQLRTGGSTIGTGGYAAGVTGNRSDAFKTGRSNKGTSQYNRNFMSIN